MRNRALRTAGRHGFVHSSQLCNRPIAQLVFEHSSSFGTFLTQGMKPTGVLL